MPTPNHLSRETALGLSKKQSGTRSRKLSLGTALALLVLAAPHTARAGAPAQRLEPVAADDLAAAAVAPSRLPSTAPQGGPVSFSWPGRSAS